jgi:transmembrane sensor
MAEWMVVELARRERKRARRRTWLRLGGMAAAAVVLFGFSITAWRDRAAVTDLAPEQSPTPPATVVQASPTPAPSTASAVLLKPEQRVLEDGTVVDLKGDALISVSFTQRRRVVRLVSGTAHFEVTHDPSRPFIVRAGAVSVRAVGTAFAVERSDEAADVLVTEGKVGVARTEGDVEPESPLLVGAGGRVLMSYDSADGIPEVEMLDPEEMAMRLQWRVPRLQLRGASLAQVVEMLNSISQTTITIADPALEHLRFSGLFRADNAAGFVQMLKNNYGVEVSFPDDRRIILGRR